MIFDDKLWKNNPSPPSPPEKSKKIRGFANFYYKIRQKYNSKSINFSIFGRDFGRIMDILRYYTDGFFGSIFDFFPKKQIFKSKSSKKLKVQKWYQNGSNSII